MSNSGKKMDNVNSGVVRIEQGNDRVICDNSDSIPTVLIGDMGNGDTGIKVSQDGENVLTCDDDKLVMSSLFNSFKIVESGVRDDTWDIDPYYEQTTSISHGLGYIPIAIAYFDTTFDGRIVRHQIPCVFKPTAHGPVSYFVTMSLDSSNLYITIMGNDSWLSDVSIKYYILRETAN